MDVEQVPRLPTFPARWVLEDVPGTEGEVHEGGRRGRSPALTVLYEIKDEATGEMLDVVMDDDQRRSNGGCGS